MTNTRKHVAILETIFGEASIERAVLEPQGYEVSYHRVFAEDEIIAVAKDAYGIMLESARITARVMDALPNCRAISRYGVGYDTIDAAAATARNIAVMNVPDYCMDEVAEHAIALMFALSRGIVSHDRALRAGQWLSNRHGVRALSGRSIGIVGYGRIGKAVAWRAAGLGMNVMAYDPAPVPLPGVRATFASSLEQLIPLVDVLTVHVPLNASTRGLIGAKEFALMKRDAVLINTARGPVVDQAALIEALQNGQIAGAGCDVHATEPFPPDSPLLALPNFVMTPHIAYHSPEAQLKMRQMAAANIADFYAGKGLDHIVNGVHL
jgi:D-3-phosphoglycerate dehydrogenase / 2-oxoglutarate reductase